MALFRQQETDVDSEESERTTESMPTSLGDPFVTAAAGSVLYSLYLFYAKGDTERGIFVGLWAPTLLSAASYLQERELVRKVRRGLSSF
ncbi:hypothetical protein [Halobaculum lipolyticum]|uniref:Uncharacterized protein n=1 Tax=Halobaculum lipolyticum TaxID=3032001 RepID=A0ABD5WEF0_9EURY|nr:hypothetical protein [Halobaculum sp. DT31]